MIGSDNFDITQFDEEANKVLVDKIYELDGKLKEIKDWCEAYPLDMFPEPDFEEVRHILKPHGITLDSISASNMRHVLQGIKNIITK